MDRLPTRSAKVPDFKRLRESGRVYRVNQNVRILWLPTDNCFCRVGFSISAKDFNSVRRNRLKRFVRAQVLNEKALTHSSTPTLRAGQGPTPGVAGGKRGMDFHVQIRKFSGKSFESDFNIFKSDFKKAIQIIRNLAKKARPARD